MMNKQEIIERNICSYFGNNLMQECKLTKILKTDTGYYVEGDVLVQISIDNYEDGWITAYINKDLSVKNIEEYEY